MSSWWAVRKKVPHIVNPQICSGFAMNIPKTNFLKELFHPLRPMINNLRICHLQTNTAELAKEFADLWSATEKDLRAHLWQSESFVQHCNDSSKKNHGFFASVGKSGSRETQLTVKRTFLCSSLFQIHADCAGYDVSGLFWEMKESKLSPQNLSLWYFELFLPFSSVFAQLYTPDGTCHGLHNFVVPIRNGTLLLQIIRQRTIGPWFA